MGERTRYQPGTFCWAGLATSDPAAAMALYASLFDWEPEPLPAGEAGAYTIMRRADHNIAICYRQTAQAGRRGAAALDLLHLGRGRRRDRRAPASRSRRANRPLAAHNASTAYSTNRLERKANDRPPAPRGPANPD